MNIKVVTIFPQAFPSTLSVGLIGKAIGKIWNLEVIDLKKYANRLDDKPFGGGNGMILSPIVIERAIKENHLKNIIFLSPRGKVFDHKASLEMSNLSEISIICGRYEGIDQRLIDYYNIEEISLGDFILCGGESAALSFVESVVRNIKGVLGNCNSLVEESFSNFLLEHHHYTQPRIWNNISVPEILYSGNHKLIEQHRHQESITITQKRRPDLFKQYFYYGIILFLLYFMILYCASS